LTVFATTNFTAANAAAGGNVDVIGTGFFDLLPGNGNYIDLDGTGGIPAVFQSNAGLITLGPGDYVLSFDLAGSQRDGVNTVLVNVDDGVTPGLFASTTIVTNTFDPFTTYTLPFTLLAGADVRVSFQNLEGPDNQGALLDNVVVSDAPAAIPEPASLLLGGIGLGGLAAVRRLRRAA
jgi:hypothetical protein